MADSDMFGDSVLFEEFEKEKDSSASFILYKKNEHGEDDKSEFIFQVSNSSSDDSDDEDRKTKVKEVSIGYALEHLQKQCKKSEPPDASINEQYEEHNGVDQHCSSNPSEIWEICKPEQVTDLVSKERLSQSTHYKQNYERNKFKRFCNIIDSTRFIHSEQSAALQIIYQNNSFSRRYRTQIEDFVKHLIDKDAHDKTTLPKLDLKSSAPSCLDLNDKIPVEKKTERMWQSHSIIGCSQFYPDFMMDTLGWPLVEYNPALTDSWEIPTYEQLFTDILPMDKAVIKANAKKMEKTKNKPKCWNCDGDHMMTECKLPRNQQKINENRMTMMANKQDQSTAPKSGRYHKDAVNEPRFASFKAGTVSNNLRAALGLKPCQLPVYVYKMRSLGYPPGWLEEAKSTPGLSMFDKDGIDAVVDQEIGEVKNAPELDAEKIIEYPGFTVEPPDDVMDEALYLGMPPLQPHQLKATLLAAKQIHQEALEHELKEQVVLSGRMRLNQDVDLDEKVDMNAGNICFNPSFPPHTPPSLPPIPASLPLMPDENSCQSETHFSRESSVSNMESKSRSGSPSLEELEEKYKLLQKTLMSAESAEDDLVIIDSGGDEEMQSGAPLGDSSKNPIEVDSPDDDIGNSSKNPIEFGNDSISSVDDFNFVKPKIFRVDSSTSIQTFGELGVGSPFSLQPGTPSNSSLAEASPTFQRTKSITKDYGTPILKRIGSVDSLPSDLQFSQGIEDHIPFENLPDSTGRFEKMRKLMDKIQQMRPLHKKKK